MSDWLFDLGNSRLKCAPLLDDGSVGEVRVFAHDGSAFEAGWAARLPARIDAAHVASVAAPALRVALLDALAARSGRIGLAATQRAWRGLRIAYAEPSRLGVDRFLAMLAAHARGGACLVVGVGTALTIDFVDAQGRHHGGRIAPSPTPMREA
ncbi:MAG TPA: type III pantothenate kinase, partial [Luteimonas sp.]|nr:type III pantothenate kinase [Luteimonas sp.]